MGASLRIGTVLAFLLLLRTINRNWRPNLATGYNLKEDNV